MSEPQHDQQVRVIAEVVKGGGRPRRCEVEARAGTVALADSAAGTPSGETCQLHRLAKRAASDTELAGSHMNAESAAQLDGKGGGGGQEHGRDDTGACREEAGLAGEVRNHWIHAKEDEWGGEGAVGRYCTPPAKLTAPR